MADLNALRKELADIQAILSAGVRTSTADGVTVTYDFDQLNRRKNEIESQLPETRRRRPRAIPRELRGG